jgi:hypothetical protein
VNHAAAIETLNRLEGAIPEAFWLGVAAGAMSIIGIEIGLVLWWLKR